MLFSISAKKAAKKMLPFLLYIIVIAAFGFVSYFNAFYNDFVWDDRHLILQNPFIHQANIFRVFCQDLANTGSASYFYRPLQNLSYIIDYKLWGFNPVGYHITNTAIHILNSILIFSLINTLTGKKLLSLLTSLFFVSHPIHYGVVTYLSGRSDSLFTAFFLISFLAFIKYRTTNKTRFLLIAAVSFILSFLSKEMAIIGVFIFILYDVMFKKKNIALRQIILPYFVFGAPLFIYCLFRLTHLRASISATFQGGGLYAHIISFPSIIAQYLTSLLIPLNLHMNKHVDLSTTFFEPQVVAASLLVLLIILLGFKLKIKNKEVSFFMFYFFIALLPVSNIIVKINALIADHWLYMPSIGYFFVISYCLISIFNNAFKGKFRKATFTFGIFIIAIYSLMTIRQNTYWRNDLTLCNKILEYNPRDPLVRGNLGMIYLNKGEFEKALEEEKKTIAFSPAYASGYYNLGIIYFNIDNVEEAIKYFKKASELDNTYADPHIYLGLIYKKENKFLDAEREFKKFIKLNPYSALGYVNMGVLKYRQNEYDEAAGFLNAAIKKDPGNIAAYLYLSRICRKKEEHIKALRLLEKAVSIEPDNIDILMDLGNAYTRFGLFDRAIACFRKAIIISPDNSALYYNMGTSYLLKKDRERAERYWKRALALNPTFKEALDSLEKLKKAQ